MNKQYYIPLVGFLIYANGNWTYSGLKKSLLVSWIVPAAIALGLAIWLL